MKSIAKKSLISCLIVAVLLVVAQVASEQYYAHSLYWIANRDQTWFVANLNLFTTLRNLWSNGTLAAAAIEAFFTFCLTLLALSAIRSSKLLQLKHIGEILLYLFLLGNIVFNSLTVFAMNRPETDAGFSGLVLPVPIFFFITMDAAFYLTIPFNKLLTHKHPAN